MNSFLYRIFIQHWPRKLIALISAIIVWFLVSDTITITRTIPNVPVKIINLPKDKTVIGLLPNGTMQNTISITLVGMKSVIEHLKPGTLEIIIDADGKEESWIASIDKSNLYSLDQSVDIRKHIDSVSAHDIHIKLSKLITETIPVTIRKAIGELPQGYQYLYVWPKYLTQKVSGPESEVTALKQKGLTLSFNLSKISKTELDALHASSKTDEVSFVIPQSWKMVNIPFNGDEPVPLNDPRAKLLRIEFLKQTLIPLESELPVQLFFPIKSSRTLNPQTYSLETNDVIEKKNGLYLLNVPVYVRDVSRLFLETVKNHLELVIIVSPNRESLDWSLQIIDEKAMEDAFVKAIHKEMEEASEGEEVKAFYKEPTMRYRFRDYFKNLTLYTKDGRPLKLNTRLDANTIVVEIDDQDHAS